MDNHRIRGYTMTYPAYPAYKDSGVAWLGDVPLHWGLQPVRRLFTIVNGSTPKSDEPAYWDGEIVLVTPEDIGKTGASSISQSRRMITEAGYESCGTSLVPAGSIVLTTRAPIGKLAIAETPLCTNQGCKTLVHREPSNTKFYYYLLFTLSKILESLGRGTTFLELGNQELASFKLVTPPLPEQAAIAAFLDHETAKIAALIARQERMIALLGEKRQALIAHAVTKGLRADAPMKDSGVAWLGEIPAHWGYLPLGRVVVSMCDGPFGSSMKSSHYADEGIRLIRLQNIGNGKFDDRDKAFILEDHFDSLPGHDARAGDLLIAGLGDENHPIARSCILPDSIPIAMVKADCFRVRLDQTKLTHMFANHFLCSSVARSEAALQMRGATRERINLSGAAQLRLPIPPLEEQLTIVHHIDRESSKIDTLIAKARQAIALMREHRTSLIAAAVTGKIDVRGEVVGAAAGSEAEVGDERLAGVAR